MLRSPGPSICCRAGLQRCLHWAMSLANRYVDTGGKEGLPANRLGRRLLIKRAGIERLIGLDES